MGRETDAAEIKFQNHFPFKSCGYGFAEDFCEMNVSRKNKVS